MANISSNEDTVVRSTELSDSSPGPKIDGNTGFRKFTAKRRNVTRACDSCRAKKRRCTGDQPCGACRPYGSHCTYETSYTRGRVPQTLPHIPQGRSEGQYVAVSAERAPSGVGPLLDERDSGVRAGTEVNGFIGPDAYPKPLNITRAISPEHDVSIGGQFVGKGSAYAFLQRAWEKFGQDFQSSQAVPGTSTNPETAPIFSAGDKMYSQRQYGEVELPEEPTTAALVSTYFEFAMPSYRFLHEPTVRGWLRKYPALRVSISPGELGLTAPQQATLLMILATALLFQKEASQPEIRILKDAAHESEKLFQAAQKVLADERGKPNLESVQARFTACIYLVMTSRPSESWYLLGTTVQLIMACGFHRRKPNHTVISDQVRLEGEKRIFWVAYTFDMYLSVIYGRPALIQDEFVDQELPKAINDDDLTPSNAANRTEARDSYITATILHAQLARITKRALQQQQSLYRLDRLDNLVTLNTELDRWQKTLPVILSGMIHPASLVPIFRRQYVVLQLGYSHAVMLVNRSLLLGGNRKPTSAQQHISTCMLAAKSTLDSVLAVATEHNMYPSLWFTQYVAFTALSVVYVWLIQRVQDRVPRIITLNEQDLFNHAEKVQGYLADSTMSNAPSLRYSIILESLQEEARRCVNRLYHPTGQLDDGASGSDNALYKDGEGANTKGNLADVDFAFDPELWQQLDGFPFSDFDLNTICGPEAIPIA